ncbi:MAG: DinB family protein [Acetobacterales bacterium]
MDSLIEHFRRMGRYNSGANAALYDACAQISEEERRRHRKAFFVSIHGTLNHIMVGDRIWMARFAGETAPSTGLDAVVHEDFDELRRAREGEDARIERFVDRLDASFLAGSIAYVNNEGRRFVDPVPLLLAHFFNHQTHHRGQVHDMLSQTGTPTPVLDLHRILRPGPVAP